MDTVGELLEDVVRGCGGMGKFQWILMAILFGTKVTVTWSMLMMTFGGATPDWWCDVSNMTSPFVDSTETNFSTLHLLKHCQPPANVTGSCVSRYSSNMNTLVSEFDLVCDRDWITSFITTIQMAGLLISCPIAGQMADSLGRKPTFFLSLLVLAVCNLVAALSVSWQMFATVRFLIGCGCGMYLTTFYSFMTEFIPKRWRSMTTAFPSWSIFAAFYGLCSWWLHDWRYVHYATAIVTSPFLLGFFVIPESFRWLISNNKLTEAEEVIKHIAKLNGREAPKACMKRLYDVTQHLQERNTTGKLYTVRDIFRNGELLKKSAILWTSWLACGYAYYAISFGVEQLSGSLYLNMFLLSAVEIPVTLMTWFLNNCIGRRWTCFLFFIVGTVGGISVGTVQVTDPPQAGDIINIAALISKMGVSAGWAALMIFSTESYPTVVRNIGYGWANSAARIGAMVAPQIVRVSKHVPGVMYYVCGACMLMNAMFSLLLPETKGKPLEDVIYEKPKTTEDSTPKENIPSRTHYINEKERY